MRCFHPPDASQLTEVGNQDDNFLGLDSQGDQKFGDTNYHLSLVTVRLTPVPAGILSDVVGQEEKSLVKPRQWGPALD